MSTPTYHLKLDHGDTLMCGAPGGPARIFWDIVSESEQGAALVDLSGACLDCVRILKKTLKRSDLKLVLPDAIQPTHISLPPDTRAICGAGKLAKTRTWAAIVKEHYDERLDSASDVCPNCRQVMANLTARENAGLLPGRIPGATIEEEIPVARESYSAALRYQADVADRLNSPVRRLHWLHEQDQHPGGGPTDPKYLDLLAKTWSKLHPVFWSKDIPHPKFQGRDEPLIQEVIRHRPPEPLLNDVLIYFEEPILVTAVRGDETVVAPLRAIAGGVAPPHLKDRFADVVMGFTDLAVTGGAIPLAISLTMNEEHRLRPLAFYNSADGSQRYLWRLLYRCLAFMGERVEIQTSAGSANRAARKSAERAKLPPRDVIVVHYRRAVPAGERGEPTGRHISVQYEVDGFWRNQPCGPGRKVIRKVWVRGHRRGPEHAPLAPKPTVIYAVDR